MIGLHLNGLFISKHFIILVLNDRYNQNVLKSSNMFEFLIARYISFEEHKILKMIRNLLFINKVIALLII